jgi:hypothetical protein
LWLSNWFRLAGIEFSLWLGDGFWFTGGEVLLTFVFLLQCAPSGSGAEAWCTDNSTLRFCDWLRPAGDEFLGFSLVSLLQGATSSRGSEAWRSYDSALRGWDGCSQDGGEDGEEGCGDSEAG